MRGGLAWWERPRTPRERSGRRRLVSLNRRTTRARAGRAGQGRCADGAHQENARSRTGALSRQVPHT